MYQSTCHCGAIKIQVLHLPQRLIQCNCSICRRYAALWGHYSKHEVCIISDPGAITEYLWGDKIIKFCHCSNCGCVTHYDAAGDSVDGRVSVNFHMFAPEVYRDIELRTFDGADTWELL